MRILRWRDIVRDGDCFHLARVCVDESYTLSVHTHDFAEVFWIESGYGVHHINGETHDLKRGDLVMIRPSDAHSFRPRTAAGFTLVNLAFDVDTLSFLKARYGLAGAFFWTSSHQPWQTALNPEGLAWLKRQSDALGAFSNQRFELERFLLNLIFELTPSPDAQPLVSCEGCPGWIIEVLARLREPDIFSRSASHLAAFTHRSPEHVTRELKRYTGMTATELINLARLTHAERQLRMTTDEISQIALSCGFHSLAHFYKRFRARFGVTPHAYRLRHQAVLR